MTTPADELRKAITVLRCDHDWPINPPKGSITRPGTCVHCGIPWRAGPLVADELIEPLAAWLEAVATDIEISEADREAGWAAFISPKHPALAIARAINGGDGS